MSLEDKPLEYSDLEKRFPKLVKWAESTLYRFKDKAILRENESGYAEIHLYTERYRYTIVASDNYLGCIMKARMSRPGESWLRGNDFPDGDMKIRTWKEIITAIARHEILNVTDTPEAYGSNPAPPAPIFKQG
jgi:hypothetical protein